MTGPTDAGGGRTRAVVQAVALSATAAFAAGGLLTQTVIVPSWLAAGPDALARFAAQGPATGATLFPIELGSVVLLVVVARSAFRRRDPGRIAWLLALVCMLGTVALLPIYFAPANSALLDGSVAPDGAAEALSSWYRWNWGRTALAVAAVAACSVGYGSTGSGTARSGGRRTTAGAG